ncbi:hypothetical protein I4U23_026237 [Adineta vaga]|nr:hypothetical protein I4U23_026237 [Adineta vaga]
MAYSRIIDKTFLDVHNVTCSLSDEYQSLPILQLEDAVQPIKSIIPGIFDHVSTARQKSIGDSILTWNESAAIRLYTMPSAISTPLNKILQNENRNVRKPWLAYLKLLISAFEKLPWTESITAWRGVNCDYTLTFVENDVQVWWGITSCSKNPNRVEAFLGDKGTLFVIEKCCGKDISAYSAVKDEQEVILMPGTRVRWKYDTLQIADQHFILHLEEVNPQRSVPKSESSGLCLQLKQEYLQNNRIELIMNPSRSFSIGDTYINLTIVEIKEQQEKEKKLLDTKDNGEIINIFEEIYSMKNTIEVKDVFARCTEDTKRILVLGPAGIGKTTFCRYVAHQWATGKLWQQYQLLVFIRLRSLTSNRYPSNRSYLPIDLVEREYFPCDPLSEKLRDEFKEYYDKEQVLWILDGYDEFVQNIPEQLKDVFDHIYTKQHHILTSRPFLINLTYNTQLEIVGFTDNNIKEYINKFFNQINDQLDNAQLKVENLQRFLQLNPRMWGISHIPVILELMCSLWCDTDWSETTSLTMTVVYDKMTEWVCRRYLEKLNKCSSQMTKEDVYNFCNKELAFLESLAFSGIQSGDIVIRPKVLRAAIKESGYSSQDGLCSLNIGILKSLDYKAIGTRIETDKTHYFVHLSFQEHFAARYLLRALCGTECTQKKATDFIKTHKYNQRFELVLNFACGLVTDSNNEQLTKMFWDTLLGKPLDLIGYRHAQLLITCFEEVECVSNFPWYRELVKLIIKWIDYYIRKEHHHPEHPLAPLLRRSPSLVNQSDLLDAFTKLIKSSDPMIKERTSRLLSDLPITYPSFDLINAQLEALKNSNENVKKGACGFFENIHGKFVTKDLIDILMFVFTDANSHFTVKHCAFLALLKISEKVSIDMMINTLMVYMGSIDNAVSHDAYKLFGILIRNTAIDEVVRKLLNLLNDVDLDRKRGASKALSQMDILTVSNELLHAVLSIMDHKDDLIRTNAFQALEKLAKNVSDAQVVNKLLHALDDPVDEIRRIVCSTLSAMGQTTASEKIISRLAIAVKDTNIFVKSAACRALGEIGQKVATRDVVNNLTTALDDKNDIVICSACQSIGKLGERAATDEVISKLANILRNGTTFVKYSACETVSKMGHKSRTDEIINELVNVLGDEDSTVRASAYRTLAQICGETVNSIVIYAVMRGLASSDDFICEKACAGLQEISTKMPNNELFQVLSVPMQHKNSNIRQIACDTLLKASKSRPTNETIDILNRFLEAPYADVRIRVSLILIDIDKHSITPVVISGLIEALKDPSETVRQNGIKALMSIDQQFITAEIVTAFVHALNDTSSDVRWQAIGALKSKDKQLITAKIVAVFFATLNDPSSDVRFESIRALRFIGQQFMTVDMIAAFVAALIDPSSDVRSQAIGALRSIDQQLITAEIFAVFGDALNDPSSNVRCESIRALRFIGQKFITADIVAAFVAVLNDSSSDVRLQAIGALRSIDQQFIKAEIVTTFVDALNDPSSNVRWQAIKALRSIDQQFITADIVAAFVAGLSDPSSTVRCEAIEALRSIDEQFITADIVAAFVAGLSDPSSDVRQEAIKALRSIDKDRITTEVFKKALCTQEDTEERIEWSVRYVVNRKTDRTAMTEIIDLLNNALKSSNGHIRLNACRVLKEANIEAATTAVIVTLVMLLKDPIRDIKLNVCKILSRMNAVPSINEVLDTLLDVYCDDPDVEFTVSETISTLQASLTDLSNLKSHTVSKLPVCIEKLEWEALRKWPPEQLIETWRNVWNTLSIDVQQRWGIDYSNGNITNVINSPFMINADSPQTVVRSIKHAIMSARPCTHYQPGWQGKLIFFGLYLLPTWIIDKIIENVWNFIPNGIRDQ